MDMRRMQSLLTASNKALARHANHNLWLVIDRVVKAHFMHEPRLTREEKAELRDSVALRDMARFYSCAEKLSLQSWDTVWLHYCTAQLFALVKKLPQEIKGFTPLETAEQKFFANDLRIGSFDKEWFSTLERENETARQRINHMRLIISNVLGSEPDLSAILGKCDLGPGASIGVSGNATNVLRKLSVEVMSVTSRCLPLAYAAVRGIPSFADMFFPRKGDSSDGMLCFDDSQHWSRFLKRVGLVDYKKISFVPKTAKTHRVIAVEPLLNTLVQKGIDNEMRERLARELRINLKDQSINQRLAREGSENWLSEDPYATIDLSSASDSITEALVECVCPPGWKHLWDSARTPGSQYNGEAVKLNQYVSMGNGFCFPLQTLLFSAAAMSCGAKRGDFHVYGDDIIVRKSVAERLLPWLRDLGFIPNQDKTFVDGPFRESCGEDFYNGVRVRPVFLKEGLTSLQRVFIFFNRIRASGSLAWRFFGTLTPENLKGLDRRVLFKQPDNCDTEDTALTVEWDEFLAAPTTRTVRDGSNCSYRSWTLVSKVVADTYRSPYRNYALAYVALRGGESQTPFALRYSNVCRVKEAVHI